MTLRYWTTFLAFIVLVNVSNAVAQYAPQEVLYGVIGGVLNALAFLVVWFSARAEE